MRAKRASVRLRCRYRAVSPRRAIAITATRYRAVSRVMASSTTPSSARVLPIASNPDSVMAAVSTNVSMIEC